MTKPKPMQKKIAFFSFFAFIFFGAQAQLIVKSIIGSEKSGLVGNYLLIDHNEAILIDAPMFKPDASKLIDSIKKTGVKLTTLFITHAHPDHYLGASEIKAAFPDVHIVATKTVAHEIAVSGQTIYDKFKTRFGADMPAPLIVPDSITQTQLKVGRSALSILSFHDGEAAATSVLWNKKQKQLFTGDIAYNKVHLYLREKRPEGWIAQLNELDKLKATTIYTGHGGEASAEVFTQCKFYITEFQKAVTESKDEKTITDQMNKAFPDYKMPAYLKTSILAYIPKPNP